MRITLTSQGNPPQQITVNDGATLGSVPGLNFAGATVFISRNGATLEGVGEGTVLANGDSVTVIPNKRVGR